MTQPERTCPSCNAAIEPGLLIDRGHGNASYALEWVAGSPPPNSKRVLGFKMPGLNLDETTRREVTRQRCSGCGLIQLYAR